MSLQGNPAELCHQAFQNDDAELLRKILSQYPDLKKRINDPAGPFDSPAITFVRSKTMLDALLEAGADINGRSRWWAGGFGLLDHCSPDVAQYALQKGARLDVHSAARLGLLSELRQMIASEPVLVNSRGGDGQTPLHFASSIEIADFLLDQGAHIDALDVDHESTPAQYMIGDRQSIVRRLVARGCKTDLLMAAALGDLQLAKKELANRPESIGMRVNARWFPMRNHRAGGTIYQWTLGFHVSPHQVAEKFGHQEMKNWLFSVSPPMVRLVNACWTHDRPRVAALLSEDLSWSSLFTEADHAQIADAARNNDVSAVELMLESGFSVEARGQHRAPSLYWAAWHGNTQMTNLLLKKKAALEVDGVEFPGTALSWALHGSENGWHRCTGDYPGTVTALLRAGARVPADPKGTPEVKKVLQESVIR